MRLGTAATLFVVTASLTACAGSPGGMPAASSLGTASTVSRGPSVRPDYTQLKDQFTHDTTLNTAVWTDSSTLLIQTLESFGPNANVITPTLRFGRTDGMTISGVTMQNQQTGIGSNADFTPPFRATVKAALTSSTGDLGVTLVTGNVSMPEGAQLVVANSGAHTGIYYQGVGPWYLGSAWDWLGSLQTTVQTGLVYTLTIKVSSGGFATLSAGGVTGSVRVGAGPFYLFLSTGITGSQPGQPSANFYVATIK